MLEEENPDPVYDFTAFSFWREGEEDPRQRVTGFLARDSMGFGDDGSGKSPRIKGEQSATARLFVRRDPVPVAGSLVIPSNRIPYRNRLTVKEIASKVGADRRWSTFRAF